MRLTPLPPLLLWLLATAPIACRRQDPERSEPVAAERREPATASPDASGPDRAQAPHHRFELPVETLGARPSGLATGASVWALMPYPAEPKKYRLAAATVVAVDDSGATVENSGSVTAAIPWSTILPRVRTLTVAAGQTVVAAGAASVFVARVVDPGPDRVRVERIWRLESRREELPAADLIVQTGERAFGQIVYYQDRGTWNQGIWILGEARHAWILSGLGGPVHRVSSAETQPWNPAFRPAPGQEVEACRSGAATLVRATIHAVAPHGLAFDVRLGNGAVRTRVPFWELLPAGTVL